LKPIYPAGSDNTGLGLDVQKIDNLITVTCLIPFTQDGEYKMKVPENMAIELSSGCERNNDISIKGMKNEIDIKSCHDIKLNDVTGPLVLSTISGDIDITYSSINTTKSSSVNSISGEIDITLPVKTATDLELRTVSGAVYSDFDFSDTQKNMKKIGGNDMNYSLNGGGFKFNIGTVSGTIYLRKGN
jgi:lia operon protein LiaG